MSEREVNWGGLDLKVRNVYVGADKPYSSGTLLSGSELTILDGVTAGTATASKVLSTDSSNELDWTYSSASTSGSTSVEPLNLDTTMTGAGGVGGRAKFTLTTNVALGGWSNALKAEVTYGASGRTTGLGSALVAEMTMSAGTTSGTYAPMEIELNMGSNSPTGTQTSLIYASVNGTATLFNSNGAVMSLNGVAGDVFQTAAVTDVDSTHALKIFVDGTAYYIPLHTSASFA